VPIRLFATARDNADRRERSAVVRTNPTDRWAIFYLSSLACVRSIGSGWVRATGLGAAYLDHRRIQTGMSECATVFRCPREVAGPCDGGLTFVDNAVPRIFAPPYSLFLETVTASNPNWNQRLFAACSARSTSKRSGPHNGCGIGSSKKSKWEGTDGWNGTTEFGATRISPRHK
jgi:hypothetical protein